MHQTNDSSDFSENVFKPVTIFDLQVSKGTRNYKFERIFMSKQHNARIFTLIFTTYTDISNLAHISKTYNFRTSQLHTGQTIDNGKTSNHPADASPYLMHPIKLWERVQPALLIIHYLITMETGTNSVCSSSDKQGGAIITQEIRFFVTEVRAVNRKSDVLHSF